MWGAPNFFSIITLRPFGSERHFDGVRQLVDPFLQLVAGIYVKKDFFCHDCICFTDYTYLLEYRQNVRLAHDEVFFTFPFQLGAGVFAIKHAVAHGYDHFFVFRTFAHGKHFLLAAVFPWPSRG